VTIAPAGRYVGESVPRVEDTRILTGRGRYIADISLPGMLHAAFVRSPFPHAAINGIDTAEALNVPGVVAVLTAADLDLSLRSSSELPGYLRPEYTVLASNRVRITGDPVAIVVAETRHAAEDGCDAVMVDYDPLPAVATIDQALDPSVPPLFDDVPSNVFYTEEKTYGDPAGAFEGARTVSLSLRPQRVAMVPMEGRGAVADYDPGTGDLTLYASNQAPHGLRFQLAGLLGHPLDRLRVISPDMGGSFGQKTSMWREDVALCVASKRVGRPVRWVEDRIENMTSATHARDERIDVDAAVTDDGTILALDVKMTLDQGAYPLPAMVSPMFGWFARHMTPASYRLQHMRWLLTVVATNKASYGAYRGPWAVETLLRELIVDQVARELGLDPVDVRRRNLITADEQPAKMITGPTLEDVTSRETLERTAQLLDYDAFREEQRQAREEGRLLGIGFSTYIEAAPGPPDFFDGVGFTVGGERANAVLEPDGRLSVYTTQQGPGVGHETTLAQVAATELGVPLDHVRIVHGDTNLVPFSMMGTGGSRAATMASGAALLATRTIKQKALEIAGDMLEISPGDLEIEDAMVAPKGDPGKAIPLADVARRAYFAPEPGEEPGIRSSELFAGATRGGWSGGTHACIVEVDPETGLVEIQRYVVVEDCGPCINPAIVDGQVRGGVAQGIGLALYEDAAYDEDGNFLAATFMDYLVPTAMEIPPIEIEHLHNEPLEEVAYKGVGEGGTIAAPPAVLNAVVDAVGGGKITRLPLTPERVLELLDAAVAVGT
jgi:carbon-monoxide dehydrogenase large subunit